MTKDKNTDLVTGRLDGIPGSQPRDGAHAHNASGHYGTDRLGITSQDAPAPAQPPARPEPLLCPTPSPLPVAEDRTEDEPAVIDDSSRPRRCLASLWRHRRRVLLAGGGVVLMAAVLAWSLARTPRSVGAAPQTQQVVHAQTPGPTNTAQPLDDARRAAAETLGAVGVSSAATTERPSPATSQPGARAPLQKGLAAARAGQFTEGLPDRPDPPAPPDSNGAPAQLPVGIGPSRGDSSVKRRGSDSRSKGSSDVKRPPRPLGYGPAPPGVNVYAIIRQRDGDVAVINSRFVKVGDTVKGFKVIQINDFSVAMEGGGKRFLVSLGSTVKKMGS